MRRHDRPVQVRVRVDLRGREADEHRERRLVHPRALVAHGVAAELQGARLAGRLAQLACILEVRHGGVFGELSEGAREHGGVFLPRMRVAQGAYGLHGEMGRWGPCR